MAGPEHNGIDITESVRRTALGIAVSLVLAIIKIVTGIVGYSWALVADGIESIADVFSSLIVLLGLRVSIRPPDEKHPYGHGKAETLAGLVIAVALLISAGVIVWQSIHEILTPHMPPAWFTLPVLAGVVAVKLTLSRFIGAEGTRRGSSALQGDAFHHASDAITSAAAFIGISIALIGGEGWETADDWAALIACAVIIFNAVFLLRNSLDEIMDAAAHPAIIENVRRLSHEVPGVNNVEKCRVRKSGLGLIMDIHIEVDGDMTVTAGHDIATEVKHMLLTSELGIVDVTVHVEPMPWQRTPPNPTGSD